MLNKLISIFSFKKKFEEAVGVYFNGNKLFCIDLRLNSSEKEFINKWRVEDIKEFTVDNQLSERSREILMEFDALDDDISDPVEIKNIPEFIAKKTADICIGKNWNKNAVALCLNVEDVVTDFDDLSNIPKDKISNTVNYQIAVDGNFEENTYLSAFTETNSGVWMEGITKAEASQWIQIFEDNGLKLRTLTAMPYEIENVDGIDLNGIKKDFLNSDGIKALFAAKNLVYQSETNFLKDRTKELNDWDFLKITATIVLTTFFIISVIFTVDFWQYRQTENLLNIEKETLKSLEIDRRKEEFINKSLAELKERNQILANLSKDSFPWRGLLIHLGTLKIENVWIKEIHTSEDNKVEIKGEAVDFDTMSNYIKTLENDSDIFSKVELKSSSKKENNQKQQLVEFIVVLTL